MKQGIRIFLDTASLQEIREAIFWGCFSGVTTNPVIISRETKDYKQHVQQILEIIPPGLDLCVEVKANGAKEMIAQAKKLASWDERIRVKIPAIEGGIKAIHVLIDSVPLNITVVKLAGQAMMCQALVRLHKPKSVVLSVFCGRIAHAGYDWKVVLRDVAKVEWPGEILAASIKSPMDISDAIANGATVITAPLDVYKMELNSRIVAEDVELFNFNKGGFLMLEKQVHLNFYRLGLKTIARKYDRDYDMMALLSG